MDVLTESYAAWWQFRAVEDGEAGGVVIHYKPSGRVEVRDGLVRRDVRVSVAEETAQAPAAPKPQPEYTGPVVRMVNTATWPVVGGTLATAEDHQPVSADQLFADAADAAVTAAPGARLAPQDDAAVPADSLPCEPPAPEQENHNI